MAHVLSQVTLRVRLSAADAHYADNLVSGARVLELFGDAATELLIRHDGTEGLFRAYREVEFLAPLRAGDFIDVTAKLISVGNTSRQMEFTATKVIAAAPSKKDPHRAKVLPHPILVAMATGTCVVPS